MGAFLVNHDGDDMMKGKRDRILTGHRPTGPRHIGHLVGTLECWTELQNEYDAFFLVADLHVLTTQFKRPERIQENIFQLLVDWLSAGIDPEKSTLVLQSALPEHSQLSLLFNMLVTVARAERVPTFKEQIKELDLQPSLGLLTYPVLQAADILLYHANAVPVGEDQLPHIELTREIARRFNRQYGETFPIPEALVLKSEAARLPGIDNRTMHTSYGNAIYLGDTPEETNRKVMSMYTEPNRLKSTDPGTVEGNPVFTYHDLFNPDKGMVEDLKNRYRVGKVGDVEVKQLLVDVLNEALEPLRDRRTELLQRRIEIMDILQAGTEIARPLVQDSLALVQEKMGLRSPLHATPLPHKEAIQISLRKNPLGFI
jgi:tryptophanyl-tRNA synthetase